MEENLKGKPGTAMSSLIPDWATSWEGECNCKDWQKKMDRWGCDSCETNRVRIVEHLLGQDEMLIPVLKAIPKTAKRFAANRLLTKAIKLAR